MSAQPACGCPIPVINPPDFGAAKCLTGTCPTEGTPMPSEPFYPDRVFPRSMTASTETRQSTSAATEPAGSCSCLHGDPAFPKSALACRSGHGRDLPRLDRGTMYAQYDHEVLNRAEYEIANVLANIRYPVPGIWMGPAHVHLPSGNLVYQIVALKGGPLDPIPVFTYNSLASREEAGFGYGVAHLFNPTIELVGNEANIITGSGRRLIYTDVGIDQWATAPAWARNALKLNYDLTWTERQPDGLEWHYSPEGCLESISTPDGRTWTVEQSGSTVTITGPTGRVTTYSPTGVTQPGSRNIQLQVTGDLLTSVTYPDGGVIALGYSGKLLTQITDPEAGAASYDYDHLDRVKMIKTPEGHTYQLEYFQEDNGYEETFWIEVTDPAGKITTVLHDCQTVQAVIDPENHRTTYVWDGSLAAVVDPKGNSTALFYVNLTNGTKALSGIGRPEVGTFQFVYDSDSLPNSVTDFDGNNLLLHWDSDRNRRAVTIGTDRFTYLYNADRQVTGTINPLGEQTTTTYDANGHVESIADGLNRITQFTYNAAGEVTAVKNPQNEITTYTRDFLGRITAVTNPLGLTSSYTYDKNSLLTQSTNAESETTVHAYDQDHRLLSTTDPLGHTTSFSYDSRGNLVAVTNAENETTTYAYDDLNRRTATTNPLNLTTQYGYDPAGNQIRMTNPENETTTTVYDNADRAIATIDPLGHRTTTAYNGANLPKTVTNAENETHQTIYNASNRPRVMTDPLGHATTIDYDPAGRPIAQTVPVQILVAFVAEFRL